MTVLGMMSLEQEKNSINLRIVGGPLSQCEGDRPLCRGIHSHDTPSSTTRTGRDSRQGKDEDDGDFSIYNTR